MSAQVIRTSPGCSGRRRTFGVFPKALAERVDHCSEFDRLGVPEVVEVVAGAAVDRPEDAVGQVVDVRVIAAGGAVAEHRHVLAAIDERGELGDGQVGRFLGP